MAARLRTAVSESSASCRISNNAWEENGILNINKEEAGPAHLLQSNNLSQASNANNPHSSSHHLQPFSCFMSPDKKSSIRFWNTPVKFFQIAARELSVLLILIETLILLGGYLIILGVHHSVKYCLSKLRHKNFAEQDIDYLIMRNHYNHIPVIARRVPRGRMAGG